MSNVLYPKGKEGFADGEIDFVSDNIKAVLVDTSTYTYDADHKYLSDVTGRSSPQTLVNKTNVNGVCDADNITFPNEAGPSYEALVLYKDSGDINTSRLIAYFDTGLNLPVTPNGHDIEIRWDDGQYKIFSL